MTDHVKIIDAHAHITPDKAALAVAVMDAAGIASAVVCEWFDGFGQSLVEHLRAFGEYPGRFHVFGNIDLAGLDGADFAWRAVEELRRGVEAGMVGLKVYKSLGLEVKGADGQLVRVNDPRLDGVWAAAGELGIPVLIHTADPRAFWEPIAPANPWMTVLGHQPSWTYYRQGMPSRDELLSEREQVIRRHPRTTFIGPHLGSMEDDFNTLAEKLEQLPNFHVDISARFLSMGMTGRRRQAARALCRQFADRILFGTDTILINDTQPTDIQPQTFLTPDRLPAHLSGLGERTLYETSVWFYQFHREFLTTGRRIQPVPFLTNSPGDTVIGLDLEAEVLHKICHGNIERLLNFRT